MEIKEKINPYKSSSLEKSLQEEKKEIQINPNVDEKLNLSENEFKKWYYPAKEITEKYITELNLFAEIPRTDVPYSQTMGNYPIIRQNIEFFKEGLMHLEKIKDLYEKVNNTKI